MSTLVNQPENDPRRGELRKPLDQHDQPGQGADLTPPFPGSQHHPRADIESENRTRDDRADADDPSPGSTR
ncbi:MAG: hypothetical protein M3Q40_08695 [Pseudomonadota bacterium]|nr:hypothetical protein [Pseudomonadota bacterium]